MADRRRDGLTSTVRRLTTPDCLEAFLDCAHNPADSPLDVFASIERNTLLKLEPTRTSRTPRGFLRVHVLQNLTSAVYTTHWEYIQNTSPQVQHSTSSVQSNSTQSTRTCKVLYPSKPFDGHCFSTRNSSEVQESHGAICATLLVWVLCACSDSLLHIGSATIKILRLAQPSRQRPAAGRRHP